MRNLLFFIASIAVATFLAAITALVPPQSPTWRWALWVAIGVFSSCAFLLVLDYARPNGNSGLFIGTGISAALFVTFLMAWYASTAAQASQPPSQPPLENGGNVPSIGSDNTVVGGIPFRNMGSGNTIVGLTDLQGNTIFNKGGTAIGSRACADATSIAIGAHAGAGTSCIRTKP